MNSPWLSATNNCRELHCCIQMSRSELATGQSQSQSQSYIATDSRSISKSWCRAPSGAHDQIFIIV
jgi:hypothetical protein